MVKTSFLSHQNIFTPHPNMALTAVGGGVQTDFKGEQRPEVSAAA